MKAPARGQSRFSLPSRDESLIQRNRGLMNEISRLVDANRGYKKTISGLRKEILSLCKIESVDKATQTDGAEISPNYHKIAGSPFHPCSIGTPPHSRQKLDFKISEVGSKSTDRNVTSMLAERIATPIFDSSNSISRGVLESDVDVDNWMSSNYGVTTPRRCGANSTVASPVKDAVLDMGPGTVRHKKNGGGSNSTGSATTAAVVPAVALLKTPSQKKIPPSPDTILIEERTPRSTRKPISYQEPSLRVKVRKGYKFFHFK